MNKLIFNLSSEYKEFNEIFCKNKNVFKKYIYKYKEIKIKEQFNF